MGSPGTACRGCSSVWTQRAGQRGGGQRPGLMSFTLPVEHAPPPPTQIRASPHTLTPIWSLEVQRQKERPAGGTKTVPGALLFCPLPGS